MQIFIANNSELELGELNEFESKHCIKVLRKKPGDEIKITNGCGDLFTGIIPLHCTLRLHQLKALIDLSFLLKNVLK